MSSKSFQLDLHTTGITDETVKDNFDRIRSYVIDKTFLSFTGRLFILTFEAAATQERVRHNLKFAPQDVIVTRISDEAQVIFLYDKFDEEDIVVTTNKACTVRAMIGSFQEV